MEKKILGQIVKYLGAGKAKITMEDKRVRRGAQLSDVCVCTGVEKVLKDGDFKRHATDVVLVLYIS